MYLLCNTIILTFLFKAVNSTLSRFFLTLHTFDRSNNLNVHIHVLIAEMVMVDNTAYHKVNFFPFDLLRKSF